jgi:phage baseplate assembly protein W
MAQHLALPLAVTSRGSLAALEQDSPAEVAQSVALLLSTEPGERRSVPDYGYESPIGQGIDVDEIASVIEEWEPRADPARVEVTLDTGFEQDATVHPATRDTATNGDEED